MTIYVVLRYDEDGEHYTGSFTTKEKAEKWIKCYGGNRDDYKIYNDELDNN